MDFPFFLMEAEVPVVTNEQCKTTMSGIDDSMICAGVVEGKDSCKVSPGDKHSTQQLLCTYVHYEHILHI